MHRPPSPLVSRLHAELLGALIAFGFGATVVAGALEHPVAWAAEGPGAGTMPFGLGVLVMGCAAGIAVQAVLSRRGFAATAFLTRQAAIRVARFGLPIVLLVGLMVPLGLYIAVPVYLLVMLRWQGHGWRLSALVAALTLAFCWVAFEWFFQLPLPKGPLSDWFGFY